VRFLISEVPLCGVRGVGFEGLGVGAGVLGPGGWFLFLFLVWGEVVGIWVWGLGSGAWGFRIGAWGLWLRAYRGTSLIRKRPPPKDPPRTLGIGLR